MFFFLPRKKGLGRLADCFFFRLKGGRVGLPGIWGMVSQLPLEFPVTTRSGHLTCKVTACCGIGGFLIPPLSSLHRNQWSFQDTALLHGPREIKCLGVDPGERGADRVFELLVKELGSVPHNGHWRSRCKVSYKNIWLCSGLQTLKRDILLAFHQNLFKVFEFVCL